ncbi:MAG: hypothetical protein WA103_02485 [Minisyncoccales bacterium]
MDIKNFLGKLSAESGKIKIAALAGFVCVAAIGVLVILNKGIVSAKIDYNYYGRYSEPCGSGYEEDDYVCDRDNPGQQLRCTNLSTGLKWNHYGKATGDGVCLNPTATAPSVALAQENPSASSDARAVADGGVCPFGANVTGTCSILEVSANEKYCASGYCNKGICGPRPSLAVPKCTIRDNDTNLAIEQVEIGEKTCTKPSILSGNGVYVCGQSPQKSQDLYSSDGSLSSEKEPFSGTIVYNLSSEETCYSGCSNGKCNNEAKCKTLAQIIQGQFSRYQSKVKDCKERWEGSTDEDKGYKCYQCYREAKESIINALADFGEKEKIFEAFGKLAYPNGLNCVDRSLVISNKSLTDSPVQNIVADDILCARTDTGTGGMTMNTACGKISVTGIQKNKICVGKDGENFSSFLRGKSFDCKMTNNGCGFAGWILGDSPEKCNPGETNVFTSSDYFSKSGAKNGNGVPVMGWGKGADRYGCEYVAYSQFAKVSDTDKSKNLYTYVQIPTGDCYKSGAAITAASDFSCADYELPKSGGDEPVPDDLSNCLTLDGKSVPKGTKVCGTQSKNKIYECAVQNENGKAEWDEIEDCAASGKVCVINPDGEAQCAAGGTEGLTFKCDAAAGEVAVTDKAGKVSYIAGDRPQDCDQLATATDEEKAACKQEFPCEKASGECTFKITPGKPNSSNSKCKQGSMFGVYVPFTLKTQGDCSGISCWVTNDYDDGKSTAAPQSSITESTATSNWSACVFPKSSYSSASGQDESSEKNPEKINFRIECQQGGNRASADTSCPFPSADDNAFRDDKSKEDEEKKEEEEQNKTAPKVTISSPSGTVDTKTAELSVSTDIEADCKYMLSRDGSFNDFSGGMFMSGGGGKSHTATLSNLTGATVTDCKYNHTVKVMCKNSKASQDAKSAVGSAQTNFSVDLSQKTENAPAVVAVMEPKYSVANPVLKVTTDRPADCEYKKDGDFSAGGGTKFDTTGSYVHNTQLNDLKTGDHTYYVVCKDKETCAANKPGLSVKFTVSLSDDPANAPKIASTTPETQTIANPALSVTTDRPATCQYKKDVSFTYDDGGGTQFANDGEYAHSVSLADLPDGKHTFYVACKDKASGAKKTLETAIVTTLNRGGAAGAPVISNTTPASQNTNSPTLSVITDRSATCQYKQDADFTYGQGMQFAIDAGTGHSTVLANAADGTYVFYVVCQDPATRISSAPGAQIIFTVNTASGNCASLSSNDRQNDNERDYDDEDDYDSTYVWRSAAAGTVEMFEKVDWYAGYQFASEEDGYATQLCGYFDSGARNRVSLYDGNYKELAGVEVEGRGGWNCANIAPVKVKADRRYYVITRVEDDAIYFSYKSGLLPREAGNTVVEYGVRQPGAAGDFGEDLKKYDYMVFGLVDAKIKFVEDNSRGPQVSSPLPDGDDEKSDLILSVQTNEDATCKFDREDLEYKEMEYTFGATGQKLHQQKICNLDDGPFTWYVRCKGATDTNDGSTAIQFEVDD